MAGRTSQLEAKFAKISESAKATIKAALDTSGREMVEGARALAPVESGDLRDSIQATSGGQATPAHSQPGGSHVVPDYAVKVTVGNTRVRYPAHVEYGTATAEAHPFFWPAFRLLKKRLNSRISRAIGKAARDAAKGGAS